MRIRQLLVRAVVGLLATVAIVALVPPGTAHAVGGQGSLGAIIFSNFGEWEHYSYARATGGTIEFAPNNLIAQSATYSSLSLRARKADWSVLGSAQTWVNQTNYKTLVSGAAYGTVFYYSACCRSSSDLEWGGYHYY